MISDDGKFNRRVSDRNILCEEMTLGRLRRAHTITVVGGLRHQL